MKDQGNSILSLFTVGNGFRPQNIAFQAQAILTGDYGDLHRKNAVVTGDYSDLHRRMQQ